MRTEPTVLIAGWGNWSRSVQVSAGRFLIDNRDHPEKRVGEAVTVQYDPHDQFAKIMPETNTPDAVHFGMELTGATPEERRKQYQENWRQAEQAVKDGKPIVLSDLICQSEQLHLERLSKPKPRSRRLAALMKSLER